MGALFAAVIVFFFLGNVRSTIIAAIAIPMSIIGTFATMWWAGYTLNTITLLALALAVGIVIDDAIVVLENIFRHIEEKKETPMVAAVDGDQGDRPRGHGDDAVAHRGLPAGGVHGRHPGAVPAQLRHHDGVLDRRVDARELHADADDGVALAESPRRGRPARWASASSTAFYRPIERALRPASSAS